MSKYDIAVIGAGSAGMIAAITASRSRKRVVLIERNARLGRKLLATGNGRCNLTNRCMSLDRFHGASSEFIDSVLAQFDQPSTMRFFEDLGLVMKEEDNGRIFPRTNQAASVVEVLGYALRESNVDIRLDAQVVGVERSDHWTVSLSSGASIRSDRLIIATGGRAAHYLGSTGDGLYWAQKLGHSLTPIHPALVPVETVETWTKEIQGTKVEARVRTTVDDRVLGERTGDLLFTSFGVSGPTVMALARDMAPLLQTSQVSIHIDLFPEMTEEQLDDTVLRILQSSTKRTVEDSLVGLLPSSLIPIIIRHAQLEGSERAMDIPRRRRGKMVRSMKDLTLTAQRLRPLKEAQVTAGGVDTTEVDPVTLESRLVKGLYFAGEILDVDGDSGGFNLQWAWSSGYVAGLNASR